jgi:hypothetical protein
MISNYEARVNRASLDQFPHRAVQSFQGQRIHPPDLGKLIAEETWKWAKVVKFAGIKPE